MRETVGDIWQMKSPWRAITTNGSIKTNGEAVMGRGVALQAKMNYPGIALVLGHHLKQNGNVPAVLDSYQLITIPVKHEWMQKADLKLIKSSLEIVQSWSQEKFVSVAIPRPGCGNGGLNWTNVKPICQEILDDRFVVVELEGININIRRRL